jgi:HD superfamily phosphohydrolase
MNILEIYKKYKIMPNLQLHMLRVGAVASLVCKNFKNEHKRSFMVGSENYNNIVAATLLHDMGNILKFELTLFPEFTQPEGLEYWESVKKEYAVQWGPNEHVATENIIKNITNNKKVLQLSGETGFSKVVSVLNEENILKMICNYADMRVGPKGVLTLQERIQDGEKRHQKNNSASKKIGVDFAVTVEAIQQIEKILFENLIITPENINDESVNKEIEILKKIFVGDE